MYRIFVVLSFTLLAFMMAFSSIDRASAQVPPSFSLPNGEGEIGESVPLNLNFQNDGQVGAINFTVGFDPNVVDFFCNGFFDVFSGPDLVGLPVVNLSSFTTNNQITVNLDQGPGQVNPLPNGEIITINFCLSDGAQVGNSSSLDITVNTLTDTNGQDIIPPVADTANGMLTVVNQPPQVIDVTIQKFADTNRIDPGVPTLITYNIELSATGDPGAQATQVEVTDALPNGSVFQADMSSDNCELLVGPANTVSCDVGTLVAGQDVVLDIVISITGVEGIDIVNQSILDYLDELSNPVEKNSNTVTVRVRSGGGGGGGGCALSSSSNNGGLANLAVLIIPAIFVLYRSRKKSKK